MRAILIMSAAVAAATRLRGTSTVTGACEASESRMRCYSPETGTSGAAGTCSTTFYICQGGVAQ